MAFFGQWTNSSIGIEESQNTSYRPIFLKSTLRIKHRLYSQKYENYYFVNESEGIYSLNGIKVRAPN